MNSNINSVKVPAGKRYIGEWDTFKLNDFPHILDKQIPGCGFTQWCLTNQDNVILCSPRKILLKNKQDQFKEDVLYLQNDKYEAEISLDKDISSDPTNQPKLASLLIANQQGPVIDPAEKEADYKNLKRVIVDYIQKRKEQFKPAKILVTYDSFHIVKDALINCNELDSFQVIVDEWQSIFIDSRFKSTTEMKFVHSLKGIQRVCFVSATPMLDEYLQLLTDFQGLPYYRLDWEAEEPGRVVKPDLKVRISKSVYKSAKKIIEPYKSGEYEFKYVKDDDTGEVVKIESREAVIYVNSVNNILSIIKKAGLGPEEVNILCADTSENRSKIKKKLGTKYKIGEVPLKGQPHKMFTFCTRTVYLGADFCSTNARTFIISDANIESLAVDISLDLPQILGRQRLDENPWKNSAEFYYRPIIDKNSVAKDEFDKKMREKMDKTKSLLSNYEASVAKSPKDAVALVELLERDTKSTNYRYNYIAVNFENGALVPAVNQLVIVAEQRAFDIQQIDYADRFTVFNTLKTKIVSNFGDEVSQFLSDYESKPNAFEKLKFLCSKNFTGDTLKTVLANIKESRFAEYYTIIGPTRMKALGYNITKLNNELGLMVFDSNGLENLIYSEFSVGDRISFSKAKLKLKDLYSKCNYTKIAKAKDLENWFEVKDAYLLEVFPDGHKKRTQGYEILSKKH